MTIGLLLEQALSSLALFALAQLAPVGVPIAPGPDGQAAAVHRTVEGILDFTQWPRPSAPVRLCLAGPVRHARHLELLHLTDGRMVVGKPVLPATDLPRDCDALYLGELDLAAQRALVARVRGAGVVTFAEADPACRSEAMFCLRFDGGEVSFDLNVDAVSRSGVTIDPRVLRMARGF